MKSLAFLAVLMTVQSLLSQTSKITPPLAPRNPKTTVLHGETLVDDYAWLREKQNPAVVEYLNAENAYTEEIMKPVESFQETIYQEILRRTKQTDLSVPYKLGGYWYYTRIEEGMQYPIHCRKRGNLDAKENVLLDLNEMAKGHAFLALGVFRVSDDGTLLAYSTDTTGFRQYQLHIKNMETGEILKDSVGQVSSVAWAADNRTIYYVKEDHAKRPYRLYRHTLGTDVRDDELLFEEKNELYRIWVYRSSDRKYVIMMSASAITNEAHTVAADEPRSPLMMFRPREEGHEYDLDHREGRFYVRTNKNAKNFRIVTTDNPARPFETWEEFVPHRHEVKIEDIALFRNFAVVTERHEGLVRLRVTDFRTGKAHDIGFPEPVYSVSPSVNPEYDVQAFRYSYQSFITPPSVFEYDMETRAGTLLKQTEVLGGYDPSLYVSDRIWAKAPDGVMVPISIVHRKGVLRNGRNPLLLYGYGSYGISIPVGFSIPRLSFLDRGGIYALAHIRGGGDLGEQWREDGRMMKKKNTFTDFIACAEHLITNGYTSADRLAIQGGSAGGLLIGAVLNMRPDLFKAAHLAVPFVDVINTMLDESLPLTVGEFLEWGNPKKPDEYAYIREYCPYTNLKPGRYPDIVVTTSFNDSQVMYWEPAKYVARLRTLKKDNSLLLLKTNMGAGHGGASGRYDAFREQAFVLSFLMSALGMST
ncbi:MAG: S9 family peptidase [Ignavibacterium sp.]|jgi:oligopeptidase B